MKRADRKTKIEAVLKAAEYTRERSGDAGECWIVLLDELRAMTEPEARPPRFNRVLRAIWVAATNEQS